MIPHAKSHPGLFYNHGIVVTVAVLFSLAAGFVQAQQTPSQPDQTPQPEHAQEPPSPDESAATPAGRMLRLQMAAMNEQQLHQLLDMLTTPAGSPNFNDVDQDTVILDKLTAIASLYPLKAQVPIEKRQAQLWARNALVQNAALNDVTQLDHQLQEMRRLNQSVRDHGGPNSQSTADYWDLVADLIEINARTDQALEQRQNAAAVRLDQFMAAYPLPALSPAEAADRESRQAAERFSLSQHLAVESRLARLRLDAERGVDAATCQVYRALEAGLSKDDPRLAAWRWMAVVCNWLSKPTKADTIDLEALPFDRVALRTDEQGVILSVLPNPPLPVEVEAAGESRE